MPELTMGSLFDGIGVFPLAASRHGIVPVWASEIVPDAISITKRHFPEMVHLGDITELSGSKIPAVDVITFGSPCQNFSQIGDKSGIQGVKSSLFYQAIRIIDEMRMVIFNLRPMSFNDLGFDRCLDDYIQNMKESNVDILFVTDIDEVSTKISEYRLLILFRMIQEAVQNSIIHSKSDRIELSVKNKGNQLLVKIRDYGIGFEDGNKKENHFGLSMMQERAKIIHAVFQIHSVLNEGTEITIQVAADE